MRIFAGFLMTRTLVLLLLSLLLLFSCSESNNRPIVEEEDAESIPEPIAFDLDAIKKRGRIVALLDNNSFSYFLHKGKPMGFEYELLSLLAKELEVELEIKIVQDIQKMYQMLNTGEGDIIAHNLTVTRSRQEIVTFTHPLLLTKQVLVQRKPENWRQMKIHDIKKSLVQNSLGLIGKEVVVRKNSSFSKRLKNLSDEIGGEIIVREASGEVETEELILQVVSGEINFTVADKNIAQILANEISDIDISLELSSSQKIAWAVRKNAPSLLTRANKFLHEIKKQPTFNVLYTKYFESGPKRFSKEIKNADENEISLYDDILKQFADSLQWDWKLLASMAYQESRFNPSAESWVGARGLMQIMPTTASRYGLRGDGLENPKKNLDVAIKYLQGLDKMWTKTIKDSTQRKKFVLASYNAGPGHVIDARNLAKKYGYNPVIWDNNVELMLLKKSNKKYYLDPIVKHGYCRCYEPYSYVKDIFRRYNVYNQLVAS